LPIVKFFKNEHDFNQSSEIPRIAILMCTYNGERFLRQQLDSFFNQTHNNWTLVVSDDGSQDETQSILNEYLQQWGADRLCIINGPQRGYVANFLSLTRKAQSLAKAEFYAWADQDDIWKTDKLQAALNHIGSTAINSPALYCGRTQLISESGTPIGYSTNFRRTPHFLNALVQSISGGNTMVFNHAALVLLQETKGDVAVVSHDWWAYQLISGAGGIIYYDSEAKILYRQHEHNVIGNKQNWLAKFRHLGMVFHGLHSDWNSKNIEALESMQHRLSEENQLKLHQFKIARKEKLPKRLSSFIKLGIYRQTIKGNIAMYFSIILKKI
jgi:glycosyltransferase involved in cell wall biosynthesis